MVVMFPALAVFLTRIMCIWGPLAPTRERLVRQMEDWAYSKKVVTVEIIANIFMVLLSVVVLVCTATENPNVPVRVWFSVHAVQCLLHVILVWSQYRRVERRRRRRELHLERADDAAARFRYNLDFFNMLVSFVWVNFGVDWVKSEHKLLGQNAPWLYWWFRAYLAFDAAFATIWLAGIIACCCLLCVILIPRHRVRTVAEQEGALEERLNVLPKYRFHMSRNLEKPSVGAGVIVPMGTSSGDLTAERVVLSEDSKCCICLCSYDDGIELHALPCSHHFHATCIEKWLRINAKCPICKYSIL